MVSLKKKIWLQIVDLRALLSLRRRLKREERSLRMRIGNTLLAQCFHELDMYYSACESERLAIIRWCLSPDKIASMEFDQFFKLVTRTRRGIAQKLRYGRFVKIDSCSFLLNITWIVQQNL